MITIVKKNVLSLIILTTFNSATTYNIKAQNNKNIDLQSGILYLSNFIISEQFRLMKENCDDLLVIDSLYLQALNYLNDDVSEALLVLTFATVPFKDMTITIPVLNIKIPVSIPLVLKKNFEERKKYLPCKFLCDSPISYESDKDKLPHFFGSAFISYNLDFFNFSKFIGILIELFEETLKVEGKVDIRDIKINSLGELFGKQLYKKNRILPSQVLSLNKLFFVKYKYL